MARLLVGTAGWADASLVGSGRFYPSHIRSPRDRLRHYADRFSLVEIDATYYAPPRRDLVARWAADTPASFTFNVKAYAPLTGHPTRVASFYPDLREHVGHLLHHGKSFASSQLPEPVVEACAERFVDALAPLVDTGKLGAVLLQFPPWIDASIDHAHHIGRAARRLGGLPCVVELRHSSWLSDAFRARTLAYFARLDLPLACVDMPQGFSSSLPPLAFTTSKRLALVRFHGRNTQTWEGDHESAAERFLYLYSRAELETWKPRIEQLAGEAASVHVIMNNCFEDFAQRNAREMQQILGLPVHDDEQGSLFLEHEARPGQPL